MFGCDAIKRIGKDSFQWDVESVPRGYDWYIPEITRRGRWDVTQVTPTTQPNKSEFFLA